MREEAAMRDGAHIIHMLQTYFRIPSPTNEDPPSKSFCEIFLVCVCLIFLDSFYLENKLSKKKNCT